MSGLGLDLAGGAGAPPPPLVVLEWTGTHPDRYSPTRKPTCYECLIRDANGGFRRYMIGRNAGGGSRGWVVWWNDKGDSSGGFLLPQDYNASPCYLDGSDRKCAWVSLKQAKAGCESHYQNWQMAAPISFLSLDALGNPTDDKEALAVVVAAHRRVHKGCSAPFCDEGRIYTALGGYVECAACGGTGQDDFIQQEAGK